MRQPLDNGQWFDIDKAEEFKEGRDWNGSNHVSRATKSPYDRETLYRTAGGKWIIHWDSQFKPSTPKWYEIDNAAAARWLVINEYEGHEACATEIAELEIK